MSVLLKLQYGGVGFYLAVLSGPGSSSLDPIFMTVRRAIAEPRRAARAEASMRTDTSMVRGTSPLACPS